MPEKLRTMAREDSCSDVEVWGGRLKAFAVPGRAINFNDNVESENSDRTSNVKWRFSC